MTLDDVRPVVDMSNYVWPSKDMYQVRIHIPYDDLNDTPYLDYFEETEVGFVFEHEADDEVNRTHCHMYFFGLKKARTTVDGFFRGKLRGNGDFSVSQTCGKKKRPLDLVGAWCYGTKEKLLEPKLVKGLSPEEQTWLRIEAIEFWKRISDARNATQKKIEIISR